MPPDNKNYIKATCLPILWLCLWLCINRQAFAQNLEDLKDAPAVKLSGSLGFSSIFFHVEGREANRQPFTWLLRGDPTLYLYGIEIPITIMVSEQERDFRQPFNRFGVSPYYKWAKVHLGYQNLSYSKYSLAGHSMVGAGVELTPGKFRFGFMHGQLLRAVQPTQLVEDTDYRALPSFKRTGSVLKLGYGIETNYVDFIILKARDHESSIDSIPVSSSLQPAENLVLSVVTRQEIAKNLLIEAEFAKSSYTEDTRAESARANEGLFRAFSFLSEHRASTQISSALDASVQYRWEWLMAKIDYQRVSPGYRSMGAYFFLNDMQKITIEPGVRLFKNHLTINTSLGFQKNNLENTKRLQTTRRIGSVRMNARIGKNYNISGFYSNYGVGQKEGLVTVDEATEVAQVTRNWGINQSVNLQSKNLVQNIILNYTNQSMNDENPHTAVYTNYNTNTLFGTYVLTWLPHRLGGNISYTYTKFALSNLNTVFQGPTVSVNKSFFNNKLRTSLSSTFFSNVSNDELQRRLTKISLRSSYKLDKHQQISLRMYLNKSDSFSEKVSSFREIKAEINYAYRF